MSDKQRPDEDSLAFMARQLLEMNQSLAELNASQKLAGGWMEGQEEFTKKLSRSLSSIETLLTEHARVDGHYRSEVDKIAPAVERLEQAFIGVAELSKSTFDMVLELKQQRDPGGEHATPFKQATQ